jgi:hypothetical protein
MYLEPMRIGWILLLTATLRGPAEAQEAHDRTRIWLGVGLASAGGQSGGGGFGAAAQLVYQRRPHQATLRALVLATDLARFPDGSDDSMGEVGVLYGRTRTRSWGHVSASAGGSIVRFERCPGGGFETCRTLGLPLTLEAALNSRALGIGLQAFGNVNAKAAYGGLALILQLGWMP